MRTGINSRLFSISRGGGVVVAHPRDTSVDRSNTESCPMTTDWVQGLVLLLSLASGDPRVLFSACPNLEIPKDNNPISGTGQRSLSWMCATRSLDNAMGVPPLPMCEVIHLSLGSGMHYIDLDMDFLISTSGPQRAALAYLGIADAVMDICCEKNIRASSDGWYSWRNDPERKPWFKGCKSWHVQVLA